MLKKTLIISMAALAVMLGACSDDEGIAYNEGDLCSYEGLEYSGTTCHKGKLVKCVNGKISVQKCANGCTVDHSSNTAICVGGAPVNPNQPTGPGAACGNITDKGVCDGNVLKFCVNGKLNTRNCSNNNLVCAVDNTGKAACAKGQVKPPVPCGNIDEKGICDGKTVKICVNGSLVTQDCNGNYTCTRDTSGKAACIAGVKPVDPTPSEPSKVPCGNIDSYGTCDGNTLKYCDKGSLITEVCDDACIKVPGNFYQCKEKCKDVTAAGLCEGNNLLTCDPTYGLLQKTCSQENPAYTCQTDADGKAVCR